MSAFFAEYTTDYIGGVMSLRTPQKASLEILDKIVRAVDPRKGMDLAAALEKVRAAYPTCTSFERDFMSLTFALATGVGKTRLMGAFIAYLYTRREVRNFFVVAPNTTIYEKLKRDLGDTGCSKYVFRGLGCFAVQAPTIVTDDDYRQKQMPLFASDVRIFIYNIDKFNKEGANMRKMNEVLGDSFCQYLANLPDLVLIMDESHHYRAKRGMEALNELKPLMGLELTATPQVTSGARQVNFKNVVLEYPLSRAIADGYTRTPYAVTRANVAFYDFGDEQMDKMMLNDGVLCHEKTKARLAVYAANTGRRRVKPFMLVVCRDTQHAKRVEGYVTSDAFRGGAYRNKTIVVHSRQTGAETEENTRLLLGVENAENPIEIVVHVNMLKEGWDVNNLYTIVPLRTAASKVLREQMVGRGLRLPYGERTGDRDVDAVMLTAHDKFQDILDEAQRGDSIFKAGNVIQVVEDETSEIVETTQLTLPLDSGSEPDLTQIYNETQVARTSQTDELLGKAQRLIREKVSDWLGTTDEEDDFSEEHAQSIAGDVARTLKEDRDLGEVYRTNEMPLSAWVTRQVKTVTRAAQSRFIPIPRIAVTEASAGEYVFEDFDLDMSTFTDEPVRNELLIQNLEDRQDRERVQGEAISFDGYQPKHEIVRLLRMKPEVDYERFAPLVKKLITQACDFYEGRFGLNGLQNIVMMFKRTIVERIYEQLMRRARVENGFFMEEVVDVSRRNLPSSYNCREKADFFSDDYRANIESVVFTGIRKGVFDRAKFDSRPELVFARLLEQDRDVVNWLRPAPREFNITYDGGRAYRPDFVVETEAEFCLVEVKGENMLSDPDVLAKKARGIAYCEVATRWCEATGYKPWKYVFIPSRQISINSTFVQLMKMFQVWA